MTKDGWKNLIFQSGMSSSQHGGRRFMPYVFTEQGIAMLSSVLKSQKAIDVNIQIMRVFVKSRHKDRVLHGLIQNKFRYLTLII